MRCWQSWLCFPIVSLLSEPSVIESSLERYEAALYTVICLVCTLQAELADPGYRWRQRGRHPHARFHWEVCIDSFRNVRPWNATSRPASPANVPAFIEAVKKRERVLSGFGHRLVGLVSPLSKV
jgi:hypothetical protein